MKTLPPETVGFPYAWEPSLATQRIPLVVAGSISSEFALSLPTSNESGRFVSVDIMLREGECPHMGQSAARATTGTAPTMSADTRENRRIAGCMNYLAAVWEVFGVTEMLST